MKLTLQTTLAASLLAALSIHAVFAQESPGTDAHTVSNAAGRNSSGTSFQEGRTQWREQASPVSPILARSMPAVGGSPPSITVPHLDPQNVVKKMQDPNFAQNFTFVIAHRGSHSAPRCAENSACAIAEAYHAGADGIELDIRLTGDAVPILAHDVTVGRELANWANNGNPDWSLFDVFPLVDYTYLSPNNLPFLLSFDKSDPNNPTRSSLTASQLRYSLLRDTFNIATNDFQLTLYAALEQVQKNYPMVVWLDVKSWDALVAAGPVIKKARTDFGAGGALANICLKVGWSTAKAHPNPGAALGLDGIYYFLAFGTGDLDDMANPSGGPPPGIDQGYAQARRTFSNVCTITNGCLGGELAHKHPGAPTSNMFTFLQSQESSGVQLAAFHNLPQYSWRWFMSLSAKAQSQSFRRDYPRTDGSCCFAPTDTLNISPLFGTETQDLRHLYSWNEANFTSITTDEPFLMLRHLYAANRRPLSMVQQIGGTNTTVPSGGAATDGGPISDGLYTIVNIGSGYLTNSPASGGGADLYAGVSGPRLQTYWYIQSRPNRTYTILNPRTGFGVNSVPEASAPPDASPAYLWQMNPGPNGSFVIQPAASPNLALTSIANDRLTVSASSSQPAQQWELTPVVAPASEIAQQQTGPAGYTYCADGDVAPAQSCLIEGLARLAYGANGSFRFMSANDQTVACNLAAFGAIDPAPGSPKACFYAPHGSPNVLSFAFRTAPCASEGGTCMISGTAAVAFGVRDQATQTARYTYGTYTGSVSCGTAAFGFDPAPGIGKACYLAMNPPRGPDGFTYCGDDRSGPQCAFSGTAAVAYGADGKFTYKTYTNGTLCRPGAFGMDPSPGAVRSCFYYPVNTADFPVNTANIQNFRLCAAQGQQCTFASGGVVRFGASNSGPFAYANAPNGSILCANSSFDHDPAPGVAKTCSAAITPFAYCAIEGGVCDLPQGAVFLYGENGSYASKTGLIGFQQCVVPTFGYDPTPFVVKSCFYYVPPAANRGPYSFTYCASGESGTCQISGAAQVAYGLDGSFVYVPKQDGTFSCNLATFGRDPLYGVQKACFYRLY